MADNKVSIFFVISIEKSSSNIFPIKEVVDGGESLYSI
jgi:hypothetical protein